MAQVTRQSPFTTRAEVEDGPPVYVFPVNPEYAVPGPDEANHDGWHDNDGFASPLRASPVGIPDANRLQLLPLRETHARETAPVPFYERYYGENKRRHDASETQDADGWAVAREGSGKPTAPRPVQAVKEHRPTSLMSPRSYSFTRPFGQGNLTGTARTMNGLHFSMADHRREYPILGMQPPVARRNTYRLEPTPWDADIIDMPPDVDSSPNARIVAVSVAPAGNRTWRLD